MWAAGSCGMRASSEGCCSSLLTPARMFVQEESALTAIRAAREAETAKQAAAKAQEEAEQRERFLQEQVGCSRRTSIMLGIQASD